MRMNTRRKTAKAVLALRKFEFHYKRPRNFLRVEHFATGVTIRAARDNFTPKEKAYFVHYLANEGFIPQGYCTFSAEDPDNPPVLEWIVEDLDSGHSSIARRARAFMVRPLVYEFLAWVAQLATLFLTFRF